MRNWWWLIILIGMIGLFIFGIVSFGYPREKKLDRRYLVAPKDGLMEVKPRIYE